MTNAAWLATKFMLEFLIIASTVVVWVLGDRHPGWTYILGTAICVSTLMVHVIVLGPGRVDAGWQRVHAGWRLTFGGISLFGVSIVLIGLLTGDPTGITVGATLISGSELTLMMLAQQH